MRLTPHEIWALAESESSTRDEQSKRYRELMKQHGYLVPRCAGHVGGALGPQCELVRGHQGKHAKSVHIFDE